VKYISDDRRFVFVGKMYDLWKGDAIEAGISVTQNIDFDRNGVSIEKIGFPVGASYGSNTLFVAPECESCATLIETMLDEAVLRKHRYRVVMLSATSEGDLSNRMVWCSDGKTEALRSIYVEGIVPTSLKSPESECNQFGLFLAQQAAMAFGIAQLPTIVEADGSAVAGIGPAMKLIGLGE
jgi:hypothetical protein